jgi:MFS family permease
MASSVAANADAENQEGAASAPPAQYRATGWIRIITLAILLFSASAVGLTLTVLQEPAKIDLGFTDLQIGLIQSVTRGAPGLVLGIPLGIAIDHTSRTRLLQILAICWSIGTAWTAFAHDFTSMFIARTLVGIGSLALGVIMSMIADLCMPEKRGRLLVLAGVGSWAGVASSFAICGALFGYFSKHSWPLFPHLAPWRQTTLAFGLAGALFIVPLLFFREPQRFEVEDRANAIIPALRGLWKRRYFLGALFIGAMAAGVSEGATGIWAAPVLTRRFGLQPNDFGAWMGGLILLSGVLGSIIGGVAADWGNNSKIRGGIIIGAVVATLFNIPAAAYPAMPSVPLFALALGTLLTGGTVTTMICMTSLTVLIPNEERGVGLGILGVIGTVVALVTAPLIAMSSQLFGGEKHLGMGLAAIGAATMVLSLLGFILAMRCAPSPVAEP